MKLEDILLARERAAAMLKAAGIAVTPPEVETMEVADFGLGRPELFGFEIVVYVNNDRYCAKEIILFPRQTCPEHRHPRVDARNTGKRETFRCRWGEVFLYTEGEPAVDPKAILAENRKRRFSAWHEIVLRPGDQHTLEPDSLHWFQAGDGGAILSEFSSTSTDENDVWTDPNIRRRPTFD